MPEASQLQPARVLLTLVWSVVLLGGHLAVAVPLTAAVVLVCFAVTQRAAFARVASGLPRRRLKATDRCSRTS